MNFNKELLLNKIRTEKRIDDFLSQPRDIRSDPETSDMNFFFFENLPR